MLVVEAQDEFTNISEDEIYRELKKETDTPVGKEVARLIDLYMANFTEHVHKVGAIPDSVLSYKPDVAIERIALDLVKTEIKKALNQ
jgi:hypothetical protein